MRNSYCGNILGGTIFEAIIYPANCEDDSLKCNLFLIIVHMIVLDRSRQERYNEITLMCQPL